MAGKTDFTPDEWKTLLIPAGFGGLLKRAWPSRGRSWAPHTIPVPRDSSMRDGLRTQLSGKRPTEIVAKSP
jgi:hypothetical protein